jgi:LmbE family N-acetylglucosaminyl deacetylase
MKKIALYLISLLLIDIAAFAQKQPTYSSSEILQMLKKANTIGSVLYIAAHPDDENTRLISYLSNDVNVRTGYLSLTRGDGGQNLIGAEKGAALGLLRTNELLEARKIDGGEQFFTSAVDFGYSKTADETLKLWDKEKILGDMVWVIRNFKPDLIITRFPPTSAAGHGHHTASAILAAEAFDAAADPNRFPEQLKLTQVWQTKRMFQNTSSWWEKEIDKRYETDENLFSVDIGTFNPILGTSYSEMSAESRSMHKSQGFGSAETRGKKIDYLDFLKGDKANKKNGIFDGIDLTWNRLADGKNIQEKLNACISNFNAQHPNQIISDLVKVYNLIDKQSNTYWKEKKKKEIENIIIACSGLYIEAVADNYYSAKNQSIKVQTSVVKRNDADINLKRINFNAKDSVMNIKLKTNESVDLSFNYGISPTENFSNLYWLNKDYNYIFEIDQQEFIGKPMSDPAVEVNFLLEVEKTEINFKRPLVYKWTDDVKGEKYRQFIIVPDVIANFDQSVYEFNKGNKREVNVKLKANSNNITGNLSLEIPKSWKCEPNQFAVDIKEKGIEKTFTFLVTPTIDGPKVNHLKANFSGIFAKETFSAQVIDYDHINPQIILKEAKAKAINISIETKGKNIGYISGPGDDVPSALKQMGYNVTIIKAAAIPTYNLSSFDAILTGIRAYNTEVDLKSNNTLLLEYANQGGTLIVQYNTSDLLIENFGPYPFAISRDRVTEEASDYKILVPEHPIFNYPNKIDAMDFAGWVQERGLYFAKDWSKEYTPLIAWHDTGEEDKNGGIIVSDYGKGKFIYTGISFFRQLPAGVPGAYKLFANIISYGKETVK